jgi:hypothetical protein
MNNTWWKKYFALIYIFLYFSNISNENNVLLLEKLFHLTITDTSPFPESTAFAKFIEISATDNALNHIYLNRNQWIEDNISLPFTLYKCHYTHKFSAFKGEKY